MLQQPECRSPFGNSAFRQATAAQANATPAYFELEADAVYYKVKGKMHVKQLLCRMKTISPKGRGIPRIAKLPILVSGLLLAATSMSLLVATDGAMTVAELKVPPSA